MKDLIEFFFYNCFITGLEGGVVRGKGRVVVSFGWNSANVLPARFPSIVLLVRWLAGWASECLRLVEVCFYLEKLECSVIYLPTRERFTNTDRKKNAVS